MSAWTRELDVAVESARAAGAIIRGYYEKPVTKTQDKGGGREENWLTEADKESDDLLKERLLAAFPDYGWLSEETKDSPERLQRKRVWIVDPLDGTREFTLRVPEFCVCVALVEDGKPVVAVEYNPATDQMFAAAKGAGTTLNAKPARVSTQARVADARVLASRSEDKRGEWDPFKPRCKVVLTGSVAFKLAELSCGNGDSTFTLTPKNEWDIAAGTLLVQEAGGKVTGLQGEPLVFNQPSPLRPGMIASNGVLHDGLLAMIRDVGPLPKKR